MKIGLWSDCHNFPSLPLMKISAYHKKLGDTVKFVEPLECYDIIYKSKVFSSSIDLEDICSIRADKVVQGGTGYSLSTDSNGYEIYSKQNDGELPDDIEHIYPDYSIYPNYNYAVGYLTRGCPRNCGFCLVSQKEGLCSYRVSELSEFWQEQRTIKLLDPNLLACKDHEIILQQLAESKAYIDITQGLDIRLINNDNIKLLNEMKIKQLHFAWDNPNDDLVNQFIYFNDKTNVKDYRKKVVYVLANYNSTIEQDLYRVYTLRDLGYAPFVMIYNQDTASMQLKHLRRWVNNRILFKTVDKFEDYKIKLA